MIILLCKYCKSNDLRIADHKNSNDFHCENCGKFLKLYETIFIESYRSESSMITDTSQFSNMQHFGSML